MTRRIHGLYAIAYFILIVFGLWILKTWIEVAGLGFGIIIPVVYTIGAFGYAVYHLYKCIGNKNGKLR